ncbi:leucine-rich alpha-2-glycoprotein-like [Mobula hypostoma]|uniref:leucine-rich alpha-2-glycoprotein-like n=1 Tax=Mobula hypostoma TaxID=723540 RepID=UPI002FC2E7B5
MDVLKITVVLILSYFSSTFSTTDCPSYCTCNFSSNTTSVTCVSLETLLEVPQNIPTQATIISIEFTNISTLTDKDFVGLLQLQELHLSNNLLENIASGVLKDTQQLRVLDLTNNLLTTLPPNLFNTTFKLTSLILQSNRLQTANPSWFCKLQSLERLDLSNNMLTSLLSNTFNNLTNLQVLDLSSNKLEFLPANLFSKLPNLERLNLGKNQLTTFAPGTFNHVINLNYLFLNSNKLVKIPKGLFNNLPQLDTLDLSDNNLTSLPPRILDNLQQIGAKWEQGLDISKNPWMCNCDLRYLWQWLNVNFKKVYFVSTTLCAKPEALRGKEIKTLSEEELMC